MTKYIIVENDGPRIASTNYWTSEYAKNGAVYLTWNAGVGRLLMPLACEAWIKEMSAAKYVLVSMGSWNHQGVEKQDALELLFEDDSSNPFCLHFGNEQTDRIIPEVQQGGGMFEIVVYAQDGERLRLPGKYRRVDRLPYLKAWVEN